MSNTLGCSTIERLDNESIDSGCVGASGSVKTSGRGHVDDERELVGRVEDEVGSGCELVGCASSALASFDHGCGFTHVKRSHVHAPSCPVRRMSRNELQVARHGEVDSLEEYALRQFGHRDDGAAVVHPSSVVPGAEHLDLSVGLAERLEALEAASSVVESDCRQS